MGETADWEDVEDICPCVRGASCCAGRKSTGLFGHRACDGWTGGAEGGVCGVCERPKLRA